MKSILKFDKDDSGAFYYKRIKNSDIIFAFYINNDPNKTGFYWCYSDKKLYEGAEFVDNLNAYITGFIKLLIKHKRKYEHRSCPMHSKENYLFHLPEYIINNLKDDYF
jgi:hypothetical protein